MRVFVTGAKGFVGGHLLPRLHEAGMEVTATDREVDVTDSTSIRGAIRRAAPDALIHLAAQSSVAASWKEPLEAFRINYLGSLTLLAAVRAEAPDARVLLIGSADAYGGAGRSERPIRESAPLAPRSPYARSKAAAEQVGALAAARGLDVVRVRAFTHIGSGQADHFVASSFARQVSEIAAGAREPTLSVGNLDSVRDFLDVRDVVDAYARLLDRKVPADIYNVAGGRGVPIRTVLYELLALAGLDDAVSVEIDPDRYRETDYLIGDASRLRAATGWSPRIELRDTLRGLLGWWNERVGLRPGRGPA
jgi:GDP-4-dehydro-6-deoxy-D-mannose reductase